jgi:hypothetical protein
MLKDVNSEMSKNVTNWGVCEPWQWWWLMAAVPVGSRVSLKGKEGMKKKKKKKFFRESQNNFFRCRRDCEV